MDNCTKCEQYEVIVANQDQVLEKLKNDFGAIVKWDDGLREKYIKIRSEHADQEWFINKVRHIESRGGTIVKKPKDPIFKAGHASCGDTDHCALYCVHRDDERLLTLESYCVMPSFSVVVPYCPFCGFSYNKDDGDNG